MNILLCILTFYKKIFLITLAVSFAFGFMVRSMTGDFSFNTVGLVYIVVSMPVLYALYDGLNPGEYYFYYNLGISKYILWSSSFVLSCIIGIMLQIL